MKVGTNCYTLTVTDVYLVNLTKACGHDVSLPCIWQGPQWAWGHVRLEALLSSRTVYGNRSDVEHLRQEAMTYLDEGQQRLYRIAKSVEIIKGSVRFKEIRGMEKRFPIAAFGEPKFDLGFHGPFPKGCRDDVHCGA